MAAGTSKKPRQTTTKRVTADAESMATRQREISVSEFFAKNRHLLGFDNPRKALLTTVKEAVDNALDACEEAGILPQVSVAIEHLASVGETRYRVTVEDNGPGVVRRQIDNIFGKLLYGSKFHRLKMSRGQQGIGISAAGMYGLMTTGKPMVIVTRSKKGRAAHHVELAMDTTKNRPEVSKDIETEDFPEHTGTRVTIELEGKHVRGRTSVDAYIEQTAIANPHAQLTYTPPAKGSAGAGDEDTQGELADEAAADEAVDLEALEQTTRVGKSIVFPRTVHELPPEPQEIKPHPLGVEVGTLMRMMKDTEQRQLGGFLTKEFSRLSPRLAQEITKAADLTPSTWLKSVGHAEAEAVYKAMQGTKFQAPPLDCLAPIGTKHILAGLLKGVRAEFFTATTRPPSVYRGNPFQIEVGLAFGGNLRAEESAQVIRFANRVPLLYQQSACSSFKAALETAWRNYGLSQPRGALPTGPVVVMIHMASVWVPFTSESKEAIADYDEIRKEMRLALQECGRKLGAYLRKRQRVRREAERRDVFERYIGEVVRALTAIQPGINASELKAHLEKVAQERTEMADVEFDDDGNPVDPKLNGHGRLGKDEDTVILDDAIAVPGDADATENTPPANDPQGVTRGGGKKRQKKTSRKKKRASRSPSDDGGSLF